MVDVDTPLVLADGTVVHPDGRIEKPRSKYVEVPSNTEAQRIVARARASLSDLPALPRELNVIVVVLTYSLIGISDTEIAIATGLTEKQIGLVRMQEAYSKVQDDLSRNIVESSREAVRGFLNQHALRAAKQVISVMDTSDREEMVLSAAKDVLDRTNNRPVDIHEHRLTVDGGLRVEIIKRTPDTDIPTLELSVQE